MKKTNLGFKILDKMFFRKFSESGIVLPLFAVFLSLLVSLVFLVMINTSLVRRARADLWQKIDAVCREAAFDLTNGNKAAKSFTFNVWNMTSRQPIAGTTLEDARLIFPSLIDGNLTGQLGGGGACSDFDSVQPFAPFGASGEEMAFEDSPWGDCTPFNRSKCFLRWKLCTESGDSRHYPATMWNQVVNAGNTVACEGRATVNQYMTAPATVEVRSAWMRRARVENEEYSVSSPSPTTAPALTVLIAPQMTTWADRDERFRFVEKDPPYDQMPPSLPHLNVGFDPLFWKPLATTPVNKVRGFSGATPPSLYLSGPGEFAHGHSALGDPEAREMMVTCSNPAVLIRNIMSSLLIELASRHGQFRTMTEVLVANPENRQRAPGELPLTYNGPSVISRFLDDIAQPHFAAPYVFYEHYPEELPDPNPNPLNAPSQARGAWLNPFESTPSGKFPAADREAWLEYHSLLASQLRSCYHMYFGNPDSSSSRGLQRYQLPRIHDPENLDFEPSFYKFSPAVTNYQARSGYLPNEYSPNEDSWDQQCSWEALGVCPEQNRTVRLSAAATVSILGSVQSCPYQFSGSSTAPACLKPLQKNKYGDPNLDLQPDLVGSLSYILNTPPPSASKSAGVVPAIVGPGIFPFVPSEPPPLTPNPLSKSHYLAAPGNVESHILIIAHAQPSNAQLAELKEMFSPSDPIGPSQSKRYVTFLYIPTQAADAQQGAIEALSKVFSSPPERMFFALSPYLMQYEATLPHCFDGTWSEAQCFRQYWDMLLDPGSDDYVVYNIRRLFFQRILTLRQIF